MPSRVTPSLAALGNKVLSSFCKPCCFWVCIRCNRQHAMVGKRSHLAGRSAILPRSTPSWSQSCPSQLTGGPLTGCPHPLFLPLHFLSGKHHKEAWGLGHLKAPNDHCWPTQPHPTFQTPPAWNLPGLQVLRSSGQEVREASGRLYLCLCFPLCIALLY